MSGFDEVIISDVCLEDGEAELKVSVNTSNDVFKVFLNNKMVCSGDWTSNLKLLFKRALEIW